uniref:Uncharacterized protein n=1 Tax=Arundo donax TaxID=35708 RepID=A0A0A9GQA7_ARUDO
MQCLKSSVYDHILILLTEHRFLWL